MNKPKITLLDTNFEHHGLTQSLASFQFNDRFPSHFEWDRTNIHDKVFFTEGKLDQVRNVQCKEKYVWLLEPRAVSPSSYEKSLELKDDVDLIFTHDLEFLQQLGDKGKYWMFGGSWIKDEDSIIYPKSKNLSIVASGKNQTNGHRLRHSVVQRFGNQMDIFGRGYRPLDYLLEAYRDYRFSVVIENVDSGICTEKIMNALLCGTVPIYWGNDQKTREYFDEIGIMQFKTEDDLNFILNNISVDGEQIYNLLRENIQRNFEYAKKYVIAEDLIWENLAKS